MLLHRLDPAVLKAAALDLALTHALHDLERKLGVHAAADEIEHDIVTAADRLVDRRRAGHDQILGVAEPHVRAVREAGQPHKDIKALRLRVDEHLACEAGAEFRDADRAGLADDRIVVRQAERRCAAEDAHRLRVVERDLARVDAGHVLKHTDHGRVIVAELVELEQVCLHAVVFKVGGDDVAVRIVGRMLHGAEIRDVLVLRDDDKAAGVLAGRALDADTAERKAVHLRLRQGLAALLKILEYVAVGRLFGQRADRSGAEHVIRAEEFFRILVRLTLIFAREVQVDIGHLVAAEAEERLKRDIEPVLAQLRAALRAHLVRHIRAAAKARAGVKIRILALRANIVRRQGVDLRDAGEIRHERRADAASAADQIAVLEGVGDELLRAHVNDVVPAREDVVQLGLDAVGDELRRVLAVDGRHLAVDKILELLGGIFDLRRVEILRQELEHLNAVGDGVRVRDDDLVCLFGAEIRKFVEHLLRRAVIERHGLVRIGEFLGRQQDAAEDLLLGIEKMHVARGNDGLAELLAELHDAAVEVAQGFLAAHGAVVEQEAIIRQRHDLKIVVKRGDASELRVALAAQHGLEHLARLAGRADDEPLAVFHEQALGDGGVALKMLQIRPGDDLIEIFQAGLAAHENGDVVRAALFLQAAAHESVEIVERLRALRREHGQELVHDARDDHRVVAGAVVVEVRQAQPVRDLVELMVLEIRQQILREHERVEIHRFKRDARPAAGRAHEAGVKVGIVRDDRPPAHKVKKLPHGLRLVGRAGHIGVRDAGQARDLGRDGHVRVDKGVELRLDLAAGK